MADKSNIANVGFNQPLTDEKKTADDQKEVLSRLAELLEKIKAWLKK